MVAPVCQGQTMESHVLSCMTELYPVANILAKCVHLPSASAAPLLEV